MSSESLGTVEDAVWISVSTGNRVLVFHTIEICARFGGAARIPTPEEYALRAGLRECRYCIRREAAV